MATGLKKTVVVKKAEVVDIKKLTKKQFHFMWNKLHDVVEIYILKRADSNKIEGAIGLVIFKEEQRIEINLLANSIENTGQNKQYDRIAGCLIAFACRMAITEYGSFACVSLVPKTELKQFYINKYGMIDAGWQLYLEGKTLIQLLKEYFL